MQAQRAQLSMAMGGLGLRSAHHVAPAAFWASWVESLSIIKQRHPDLASHIVNNLEHPPDGMSKSLHELLLSDAILRGDGFQHQGTWTDFLAGCRIEREGGGTLSRARVGTPGREAGKAKPCLRELTPNIVHYGNGWTEVLEPCCCPSPVLWLQESIQCFLAIPKPL